MFVLFFLFHLLYFNDLFNQFEYNQDVLTVQAGRWRPVMLRPVMLTDLIKHNTSLQYDRLRSPDVLIHFVNQFVCTYKVLAVPARRWRPVMLTDLIKQYTIFSYNRFQPRLNRLSQLAIWTNAMKVFAAKTMESAAMDSE